MNLSTKEFSTVWAEQGTSSLLTMKLCHFAAYCICVIFFTFRIWYSKTLYCKFCFLQYAEKRSYLLHLFKRSAIEAEQILQHNVRQLIISQKFIFVLFLLPLRPLSYLLPSLLSSWALFQANTSGNRLLSNQTWACFNCLCFSSWHYHKGIIIS